MQTITLKISDDFMPKFLGVLEAMPKSKVKIKKDDMSIELEKRIKEIEDGTNPAVPFEYMWENLEKRILKHKNEN